MCVECDPRSYVATVFRDDRTGQWVLETTTCEWDNYNDDYIYSYTPINYCPFCGRKLDSSSI